MMDRGERRRAQRRFERLAVVLRSAAWSGIATGDEHEREYLDRCRVIDPETHVSAILSRDIGHDRSEVPIPIGARCLHLSIASHGHELPASVLETLVHNCFFGMSPANLTYCGPRSEVGARAGVIHVFVLCDESWRPVGPPAWAREVPANDVLATSVGAV